MNIKHHGWESCGTGICDYCYYTGPLYKHKDETNSLCGRCAKLRVEIQNEDDWGGKE